MSRATLTSKAREELVPMGLESVDDLLLEKVVGGSLPPPDREGYPQKPSAGPSPPADGLWSPISVPR